MRFTAHLDEGPPPTMTVSGRVDFATADDLATADELAERLTRATRGGLYPVTVDLTEVEILASAGVRVLLQLRERLATHDNELMLVAAPGSPAQVVLDLVGLDHKPGDVVG